MNWEVTKRVQPCAWFRSIPGCLDCRWCKQLHHVRVQGASRTLCGHSCDRDHDWMVLDGFHPEDVSAIDRCRTCYQGFEGRRERERRDSIRGPV